MDVDKNLGGPPLFAGCGAWDFARRRRGGFVPSGCGGRISCSIGKKGDVSYCPGRTGFCRP
ncbi:hypothetical protein HMPREF1548_04517 [Clostridium sp. KLE 1755]|uniref:Uncharacterized protein n=1 Tax=Eisenbergiella massiliensis TaxID=1720294 RepID=A0A3E3HZK3_9FIRM|nr:hypothetical protein HMPREF1548_04517 [Clostridium sp. KLE 1755]RGE57235.1 hypothetical protein DXC51_20645 [Eisenbergiella massiliensis]